MTGRWLLLILACPAVNCIAQDNLPGRLFFTPEQRAEIDRQRQTARPGGSLNGEVRRSSGPDTRWINGKVEWENNSPRQLEWQKTMPEARITLPRRDLPAK